MGRIFDCIAVFSESYINNKISPNIVFNYAVTQENFFFLTQESLTELFIGSITYKHFPNTTSDVIVFF